MTSSERRSSSKALFKLKNEPKKADFKIVLQSLDDSELSYDVISCTIPHRVSGTIILDDQKFVLPEMREVSTIIIDGKEVEVPQVLVSALSHLRQDSHPRVIYNDILEQMHVGSSRALDHLERLPLIHREAKVIVVWAGTNDEEDPLFPFIGPGTPESTEEAYSFARQLSGARDADIPGLFNDLDNANPIKPWMRFQQLVYRDFFRGDSVLCSNYRHSLTNLTVQAGHATIPYTDFQRAADLLLRARPYPSYLCTQDLHISAFPPPEMVSRRDWTEITAYRNHLNASVRFGSLVQVHLAELMFLRKHENKELQSRINLHMGFCQDTYDRRGGTFSEWGCNVWTSVYRDIERSAGKVTLDTIQNTVNLLPRATPDFNGQKIRPVPFAVHREPFIHSACDWTKFNLLLEILPDGDLQEPLQCGLVEVARDKDQEICFVTNHMYTQSPLYEARASNQTDHLSTSPPLITRSRIKILVSGRSYEIPTIQQIFLRLLRHHTDSKYVYLWNVCEPPDSVGLFEPAALEQYARIKHHVLDSGTQQIQIVDMYKTLEDAGSRLSLDELLALGLPDGSDWWSWLLKLAS